MTRFQKVRPGKLSGNRQRYVVLSGRLIQGTGDDAAFIASALGENTRAKSMTYIAAAGLNQEGVDRTPSKDGNPRFSAILKVMKEVGLKLKL